MILMNIVSTNLIEQQKVDIAISSTKEQLIETLSRPTRLYK